MSTYIPLYEDICIPIRREILRLEMSIDEWLYKAACYEILGNNRFAQRCLDIALRIDVQLDDEKAKLATWSPFR